MEVSAWTKASSEAAGVRASTFRTASGSTARPHSCSTTTASAPQRCTFSFMRPPKTPLTQTTTVSPGCTRLTKQASMPTEPGPEIGIVSSLVV